MRRKTLRKYNKKSQNKRGGSKFEREVNDIIELLINDNKNDKEIREAVYQHFGQEQGRAALKRNRETLNKVLHNLNNRRRAPPAPPRAHKTKKGRKKYEGYSSYPELSDQDVYKRITQKKEFFEHRNDILQDRCSDTRFKLTPHQQLLSNFMNPNTPYKSLLLFHGTGTGKTCTSISIAETFKDQTKDYGKIIIICGRSIIDNFKSNLFDKNKLSEGDLDFQCTGRTYYDETDLSKFPTLSSAKSKEEREKILGQYGRAINKKVEEYYSFNTYYQFATGIYDRKKENGYQKYIRDNYSNKVIIVDEVQSLRSKEKKEEQDESDDGDAGEKKQTKTGKTGKTGKKEDSKKILDVLLDIAKYAIDTRFVLLSATPMFDSANEYMWLLKLMRINDNKPMVSESEIFDKHGNVLNRELLKELSTGYISYVRSEDPINYPLRDNSHPATHRYINPSIDFFGVDISTGNDFEKLGLYCLEPGKVQKEVLLDYQKQNFIANGRRGIKIHEEELLKQMSLIVYPDRSTGVAGFRKNFEELPGRNATKTVKTFKYGDSDNREFLKLDTLKNFSVKFYDVIKSIDNFIKNNNGIIFVFCSEVVSGIIPFCLALEQNGYDRYDKGKMLDIKGLSKIEKKLWHGKKGVDKHSTAKYITITGKDSQSKRDKEIRAIKHIDNLEGKNIRIVIGSETMSEGISLKWVRQIHILDPWYNLNRIEQIIGRGIRFCSHKEYPREDRNVKVFLHAIAPIEDTDDSKYGKGKKIKRDTSDIYLYKDAWRKAKQIGIVEKILKESAIDCTVHRNTNILPDDKPYSKICNYNESCEYTCNVPELPSPQTVDNDTYKISHSKNKTDQCTSIIKEYFKKNVISDFNILLKECSIALNMKADEIINIVSHALNNIVESEINITNDYVIGKIKYRKGLYIFEELGGEDEPLHYRNNKTLRKRNKHNILSLNKEPDVIKFFRKKQMPTSTRTSKRTSKRKTISKSRSSGKEAELLVKFNKTLLFIKNHKERNEIEEYLSDPLLYKILSKEELLELVDNMILDRLVYDTLIDFLPILFKDESSTYQKYRDYFGNTLIEDKYMIIFDNDYEPQYFMYNKGSGKLDIIKEELQKRQVISKYDSIIKKQRLKIHKTNYSWIHYDKKGKKIYPKLKIINRGEKKTTFKGTVCNTIKKTQVIQDIIEIIDSISFGMSTEHKELLKTKFKGEQKIPLCYYYEIILRIITMKTDTYQFLSRNEYGNLKLK